MSKQKERVRRICFACDEPENEIDGPVEYDSVLEEYLHRGCADSWYDNLPFEDERK